jgi:Fic family protein
MNHDRWTWQAPDWPRLTFDSNGLAGLLAAARHESGRLLGKAEVIGLDERTSVEREVWAHEAVATAAIEGETLDLRAVRSSVARRLGLAHEGRAAPRNVEGLLDVMENAADAWQSPLTHERLCAWHAALFPGGSLIRRLTVGEYRNEAADPMQIVSGPIGRETVHYLAVPGATVKAEMHAFLEWFNATREGRIDGLLRAGFAHVWFESIHPFEDGNGRIGRAIIDLALAQDARRATRLHGVAAAMQRQQDGYYDALNAAQRGDGDVTPWLDWFLRTYADACGASIARVDEALVRARFWSDHRDTPLNAEQRKVLNRMLEAGPGRFDGGLTPRKYQALTGIPRITASRHIADLVAKGVIARSEGAAGRSTHYNLAIPGWEWPVTPQSDRDPPRTPARHRRA